MLRQLLTLFFLSFLFSGFSQLNAISAKINKLNNLAYNLRDSDPVKAEEINRKAFRLLRQPHIDRIVLSDVYSIAGTLDLKKGEYESALNFSLKSLRIREKTGDLKKIADINKNIANLYYQIEYHYTAIRYYNTSLEYGRKLHPDNIETIGVYNGLTQAFESIGEKDSALLYYNKAVAIARSLKDKNHQYISDLYSNLGQFYEMEENYLQANAYFNKALAIQQELDDYYGMAWTLHHLGIVSDYRKNSPEAKAYYNKAGLIAVEQSDLQTQLELAKSWMLLYARERNTDSVNYYFDKYETLNDLLNEKRTKKSLSEANAKYNTEKAQEKVNDAEAEKEVLTWMFVGGLLLAALIFIFLIRNYRQKQHITNMQIDLKNREMNELLVQQESASYAAMLEGQDQERQRIAQDLHDRLGSTLAAIKLGLESDVSETHDHHKKMVDTAMNEVRAIAHDLSAGNIEKYGLNAALEELKHSIEHSGRIRVNLYLDEKAVLTNQLKIELYRIVQELIANTLKHANAKEITIQTHWHDDHFNLIFEDDGTGFDQSVKTHGMGHQNITARLKKLQGNYEIDSQPERGTIVIVNMPTKSES